MPFHIQGPTDVRGGYVEILKFPAGDDAIASVVLDASAVAEDSETGVRILKAGTLLTKNANGQYERFTGAGSGTDTDEVQTLTIDATGGTFTLTFDGETTDPIAENAAAATVQTALENLSNLNPDDVTVTGSAGGPYTITFGGDYAGRNVPELTADDAELTGGAGTAVVETDTAGDPGTRTIAGVLAYDVEFYDALAHSDTPAAMFFHGCVFRADRIVDFQTHGAAARAALPTCRFD